jgi:signal transduction histidine kinase/CheY-like chemotaxis protein
LVYANRMLTRLLRYAPGGLVGEQLQTILTVPSWLFLETQVAPRLSLGGVVEGVFLRLRPRGGGDLPMLASFSREVTDGRSLHRCVFLAAQGREEYEQTLEQSRAKAEAGGREQLRWVAGAVAHDFNNLLASILGSAELLRGPGQGPLGELELSSIRSASARGRLLTGQLLAFTGQAITRPEPVVLDEQLGSLAPVLRHLLPAEIELHQRLGCERARVLVDPKQLELALVALVTNARDATVGPGSVDLGTRALLLDADSAQRLGLPCGGAWLELTVHDTGAGLTQAARDRLFEPFFTTKPRSMGLGLATVQAVAKQGGGRVLCLQGEPGEGTTFALYLPALPAATQAVPAARAEVGHRSWKVLVVDDEPGVRRVVQRLLQQLGHQVLVANSAADALQQLATHGDREVVLTDFEMPGMNGAQLVQEISARYPEIRGVLMSGYTADEVVRGLLGRAGARFLQKPFDRSELEACFAALVDGPREQ